MICNRWFLNYGGLKTAVPGVMRAICGYASIPVVEDTQQRHMFDLLESCSEWIKDGEGRGDFLRFLSENIYNKNKDLVAQATNDR